MVCSICGCSYEGEFCPICGVSMGIESHPFAQYDYFPRRSQIRQMVFEPAPNVMSSVSVPPSEWKTHEETASFSQTRQEASPNGTFQSSEYGFCPKCGNVLRGNFCTQCGYFSGDRRQGWKQTASQSNTGSPTQPKTKGWVIGLVITLAVLLVAAIIGLVVFWMSFVTRTVMNNNSTDWFADDSPFYHYEDGQLPEGYDNFEQYLEDYFYDKGFGSAQPDSSDTEAVIPEDEGESLLPSGVSNAEYQQLKVGMSYSQISAIIGGDGTIASQDGNSYIAVWPGEYKPQAIVTIEFEDNVAVSIEQSGLFETNN
jgi:hypothetical protein